MRGGGDWRFGFGFLAHDRCGVGVGVGAGWVEGPFYYSFHMCLDAATVFVYGGLDTGVGGLDLVAGGVGWPVAGQEGVCKSEEASLTVELVRLR